MKATQSEVAMRAFAAFGSTGENLSPAARGQRESATFASSINGDRDSETEIPTGKNSSPGAPQQDETTYLRIVNQTNNLIQ